MSYLAEEKIKSKSNLLTIAIVAVVVGALAFFGGMQYQKSQQSQFPGLTGQRGNGIFARNFQNGMRPVSGIIISQDNSSITIKLMDGSSKIINISSSTSISKAAQGSIADLKTGQRVAAFGTTNSDGSINAQNISIGIRMFGRGPTQ